MLDGTAADLAIFKFSDPAVTEHYAREQAYKDQLCASDESEG